MRQDLDQDIFRHPPGLHQAGYEIELGSARAGETDLDLFHTDFDQKIEEAGLLVRIHRIDNGLIAIAQIGADSQRGGAVMVRVGHCRSVSGTCGKGEYLALGLRSMDIGKLGVCESVGEVRSLGRSAHPNRHASYHAQGRVSRRMIRPSALCIPRYAKASVRVVKQNSLGHRQKLYFTVDGREHGRDTFAVTRRWV